MDYGSWRGCLNQIKDVFRKVPKVNGHVLKD